MRTTIRLDDDLLLQVKETAARSGKTLTSLIEDALREMLARQQEGEGREPVRLTMVSGGGLQPGADLDDSAALLLLMEASDRDYGRFFSYRGIIRWKGTAKFFCPSPSLDCGANT
jgi:hypothetical protein